jgi:hypothetical protein
MAETVSEAPAPEEAEPEPAPDKSDGEEEAEPEGEPEPADEPELEPPAGVGPSQKEIEAMFVKAEKAVTSYVRRISDIFGDQALDLAMCPLCPPQHKGFVNVHDAGKVPDDIGRETLRFLGQAIAAEFKQDAAHDTCGHCDGLGKVKTGSRVVRWETIGCEYCKGCGFYPPPSAPGNGPATIAASALSDFEPQVSAQFEERDPTGEPRFLPDGRENPNYMKWPQGKILVEPWGVTAGLSGVAEAPVPVGE